MGKRTILTPMRWLALTFAFLASASCGGSSSPSAPSAPPATGWSMAGVLVDSVSGNPVPGAALTVNGNQITTGDDGGWRVSGSGSPFRQSVRITAAGYVPRETYLSPQSAGRSDVRLEVISNRLPFSLDFYRELVRNGFEEPSDLQPIARWTTNPNFYIDTANPRVNGSKIDSALLDTVIRAIRETVPQLTGGQLSAGEIESGSERAQRSGYVNIKFVYEPDSPYCGQAFVGANPGEITLNYDRCSCGSAKVPAETVAHEVGHALGFWHTEANGLMNPYQAPTCGSTAFSEGERLHAKIAYARPVGNTDMDRDPLTSSAVSFGPPPLVSCPRVRADRQH